MPPIETIRLSSRARDQLRLLKSRTKIENWNILCRWAFCMSLTEPTIPTPVKIITDSSVEMTWKVFGGKYADVYWAILKQRCNNDGLELIDEVLIEQFKLHLHRGISYLSSDKSIRSVTNLLEKVV